MNVLAQRAGMSQHRHVSIGSATDCSTQFETPE